MRFLVAPDSFKGSLSANQAGQVIESALTQEIPQAVVEVVPMADGGEGTVDAFLLSTDGKRIEVEVTGPTGEKIQSYYGVLGDGETAVIEAATIVGFTLVPEEKRHPVHLTTYGVGECILHALDSGFRRFIIGLGGSATNDGGLGMLQALGVTFRDDRGNTVTPFASSLPEVYEVDYGTLDERLQKSDIRVASDVDNPLCGPDGATHVFSLQKGAKPEQLERLDQKMASYANCIEHHLDQSFQHLPGAGAAGGLGFALMTIGGVRESGASLLAEVAEIDRRLAHTDWLITGEGKTDAQTLHGKAPYYLAKLAGEHDVPTVLLSGCIEGELDTLYPIFTSMHAIGNGPMSVDESMKNAESLLYDKARNIARLLKYSAR